MPGIPTTVRVTETGFEPAFRRVQQAGDFDCAFAVVAMIANTTLEAVRGVAIARFHHPAHGVLDNWRADREPSRTLRIRNGHVRGARVGR